MNRIEKLNTKTSLYKILNKEFLIYVGIFFGFLFAFTTYYGLRIESKCESKVTLYESIMLEISLSDIKFEDAVERKLINDSVISGLELENIKTLLNNQINTKYWDDFFISNYTKQDINMIESVLQKIHFFESLIKKRVSPESLSLHNGIFNQIMTELKNIRLIQHQKMNYHDNIYLRLRLSLFIIFGLFSAITFFIINKQNSYLKKKQLELQNALEITHLGTFIFDDQIKTFKSSSIFDDIVGINANYTKDLPGWLNLIHPDNQMRIIKLLEDDQLDSFNEEFKIINFKNKKTVWVLGHAKKDFNYHGNRIKVTGTIQDITERKVKDEKLLLLNQALFQSPEAVLITKVDGKIEYVNPAFVSLSGYSEEEVLGKTPRLLRSENQKTEFYERLWSTILDGQVWTGELINKHKDGSNYLVNANVSPVKNNAGDITYFIGILQDITEKRKLERDFIHAFVDAQEQEKISFGEDLHDGIGQILSAESMYIHILKTLVKSDDKRIAMALDKIDELNISAISDTRGIAHGLMSKQLQENGLLIAVKHLCEDYDQSKKSAFNFTNKGLSEDEIAKEIKINIFRIAQEVSTNIIRHSGAKNTNISFSKTMKNQLQIIIKDDGVGIDLEKMAREKRGAGLKNIERRVTLLNGKLNLETAPDQGTCYTIIVPLETL